MANMLKFRGLTHAEIMMAVMREARREFLWSEGEMWLVIEVDFRFLVWGAVCLGKY